MGNRYEQSEIPSRIKDEAVRQVTARGYSINDVAENLGVSQHSRYKWVKACSPSPEQSKGNELSEAKKEILQLRSQLNCAEDKTVIS
ncbi:transposase [Shewanella yunxiaonensis]|uniref:Transposase n=1 Tax=Shewanella yunxiaonensis TaxID=2829809 RepID=A0ABX7YXT0_9GAMM|nr:transposase [Shewanella yunxiaonensis]